MRPTTSQMVKTLGGMNPEWLITAEQAEEVLSALRKRGRDTGEPELADAKQLEFAVSVLAEAAMFDGADLSSSAGRAMAVRSITNSSLWGVPA